MSAVAQLSFGAVLTGTVVIIAAIVTTIVIRGAVQLLDQLVLFSFPTLLFQCAEGFWECSAVGSCCFIIVANENDRASVGCQLFEEGVAGDGEVLAIIHDDDARHVHSARILTQRLGNDGENSREVGEEEAWRFFLEDVLCFMLQYSAELPFLNHALVYCRVVQDGVKMFRVARYTEAVEHVEEVNELVDERWRHDISKKLLAGCVLLAIYLALRTIRSLSTLTGTLVLLVEREVGAQKIAGFAVIASNHVLAVVFEHLLHCLAAFSIVDEVRQRLTFFCALLCEKREGKRADRPDRPSFLSMLDDVDHWGVELVSCCFGADEQVGFAVANSLMVPLPCECFKRER